MAENVDVKVSAQAGEFVSAMNAAKKSADQLNRTVAGVTGVLGGAKRAFLGLAAAAGAGVSVAAMKAFVGSTMDAMDATAKVSDRLGIATESLIRLRHVADLAGVGNEQFDNSLEKMTRTMGDAINGSSGAQEAFTRIGLSAQTLANLSPEEQFARIADGIRSLRTPAEQAAAAQAIFGRGSGELLNTLNMGSDAIRAQAEEADKLGLTYSRVDAAKVEAANDALSRAGAAIAGVGQQIAIGLAPFIELAATKFAEFTASVFADGSKITGAIEMVASGAAFLADTWDLVKLAFTGMQTLIVKGLAWIVDGLNSLVQAANTAAQYLGSDAFKGAAESMQNFSDGLNDSAEQAGKEWMESFTAESSGEKVRRHFEEIRQQAQTSAEQVAKEMQRPIEAPPITGDANPFAGFLKAAEATAEKAKKLIADKASKVISDNESPLEKYKKELAEIEQLKSIGAIDAGTFGRAKGKLLSDLDSATAEQSKPQKVSALERGSAAAFSAERDRGQRQKTEKDILEQAKKQNENLDRIAKAIEGGEPVEIASLRR